MSAPHKLILKPACLSMRLPWRSSGPSAARNHHNYRKPRCLASLLLADATYDLDGLTGWLLFDGISYTIGAAAPEFG